MHDSRRAGFPLCPALHRTTASRCMQQRMFMLRGWELVVHRPKYLSPCRGGDGTPPAPARQGRTAADTAAASRPGGAGLDRRGPAVFSVSKGEYAPQAALRAAFAVSGAGSGLPALKFVPRYDLFFDRKCVPPWDLFRPFPHRERT